MKKALFSLFILFACYVLLDNRHQFTAVSAQIGHANDDEKLNGTASKQQQDEKYLELAQVIKRLTNRSADELALGKNADGELSLEVQDGFQNVMLAKTEADGEILGACVTSLDESNAFFGKNLETGERVPPMLFEREDIASVAARHGMSEREYEFYKNLIEVAAGQRALAPNAATITISNGDGAGEGFNDPTPKAAEGNNNGATLGEQRLNLFNFAAGIWGAYLDTSVPIVVASKFDSITPCSTSGGVLGSAGATGAYGNFLNVPFTNTYYHVALANKISGSDRNGVSPEITATFNSDVDSGCLGTGTRFYYGLNNTTPAGRVNLLVVLLHEMGHGLGFSSYVNGSTGAMPNGLPDAYTRNMYDRTVNKYWHQMTDAERQVSKLNAGNVLWDGANVKVASSYITTGRDAATGRVQLYTPSAFQSGSSISHFDSAVFPNLLMEPSINTGLPIDLDLTRQQMRDLGWFRDTNTDTTPDSITNVKPGGNTIAIGSNVNITWTNGGGFNRNVTIEISTNGGAAYSTIASDVANTGSYSFTVPNTPTTQGRIRVREANFADPAGVSSSNFTISAPTAAAVTVRGRVLSPSGRGVSSARVYLTDLNGNTRSTITNSLGYYRFVDVGAGETYIFSVTTKQNYQFSSQAVTITADTDNLNFMAQL